MVKIFVIPEENLDRFYERTINYLRDKYHGQPTNIRPTSPSDNAQSAYAAQGRHEAARWDGSMPKESHR